MKVAEYLGDVTREMRKVSWPARNELISNTLITLLASMIISLYIWGADQIISRVLEFIYS